MKGSGIRLRVLSFGLLLAALYQVHVFLSTTLAARDAELWFFLSSDTVQYGLLYKDLFDLGFHYAGWNISHAPEYGQMLWALLVRSFSSTLTSGHVREALTQPILLAVALHFLLRRVLGRATALAPIVVASALLLIARGVGLDFIAIIWSNRHGFTALITVAALSLALDLAPSTRRLIGMVLLVGLGVASDLLFLAWFVAPAAVAIALSGREARRPWAIKTLTAMGAGVLVGLLAFWLATPVITVGDKIVIDLSRTLGSLGRMADDARSASLPQALLNALLLVGFITALISVWRSTRIESRVGALYATFLPLVTLGAMALTSAPFRESGYTRYLLAPELAALTVILIGATNLGGRSGEPGALIAVTLAMLPGFTVRPSTVPPVDRYYPPLVRCIDDAARKHGLQYGVADYWLAKYVTALSANDLSVVAVTPRLDPYIPFSNIEWFLGGVGARRHDRPTYTFAILGATVGSEPGIAPQAVSALGEPVAVETCFGFRVVVLPNGSDQKIRGQFAENRMIREYYRRRGLSLPSQTGEP